jgi:DnaJ-class molecular chaperone
LGNSSDSDNVLNGDLLVKVLVKETLKNLKRVEDDLHYELNISLIEAIFGCKKEIDTIEGIKEIIDINPGVQSHEKIVIYNRVKIVIYFIKGILCSRK